MKFLFFLVLFLPISIVQAGNINNIEAKGNLQSNYSIACEAKEKLKNIYTPADLYPVIAKCANEGKYIEAVYYYMIANVYGYYDRHIVSDKTAGQAMMILQQKYILSLDNDVSKELNNNLTNIVNNKDAMNKACKFLRKLGKPNYHPTYMIQHGIKAFTGISGDGLLKDIDSDAIWEEALVKYIKCDIINDLK